MKPSSSSAQTAVLTVTPEQAGKRLDLFLTSQLPFFSRTQVQALIQKGKRGPSIPGQSHEGRFGRMGGPVLLR